MTPKLSLLFNALGLILVAETLPLLVEMLVLSLAAALPLSESKSARARQATRPVKLAVIVPAHNEEHRIGECVRSLLGADHQPPVVIYVVAHNCCDDTEALATAAGAQVLTLTNSIGGKAMALDFGFRQAVELGAEAVLVIDADSVAGPGLIKRACEAFAAGAAAVQCRSQVATGSPGGWMHLQALALAGTTLLRPLGRARLGLSCGLFGNGFGVTSQTLAQLPYPVNPLLEPLEYHLRLLRINIRVEFLNDVSVFAEMPHPSSGATPRHVKGEGGRLLMRRIWIKPLLREILRGRITQIEPLLDLLTLPLATEACLFLASLLLGQGAGFPWLTRYAAVGLCACGLYVGSAASLSSSYRLAAQKILAAPASWRRYRLLPAKPQSPETRTERWLPEEER